MAEIYKQHAKMVYGFLLAQTKNPELAEELTQETFYQAVKSIGRFEGKSHITTWLCGIAKNVWRNYLRQQKDTIPLEELSTSYLLEVPLLQAWDQLEVLKCIHHLEEPMREVMYLRLISNLKFKQIGEILGQSENWARVNYYRGKEKVIKEVEENENTL